MNGPGGEILTMRIPDRSLVLSQARALDQIPHEERGPLHGAAVAVKDIIDTKGTTRPSHA